MGNIKINGVSYVGDSLVVKNNKIFIDGKEHEIDSKTINISVIGNIDSISADSCQKIYVKGDVNTLKTMSGDVEIEGIINEYKILYPNIICVLTGGDSEFLAKRLKNSIFTHQNLVLIGLNDILNYNLEKK